MVQLIRPRRFEPWLSELRDRISGRPERFELCRADVTEVAVTAFDVVEVVDVIAMAEVNLMVVAHLRVLSNSTCSCAQNASMAALSKQSPTVPKEPSRSLIPGQGSSQRLREFAQRADESVADGLGSAVSRQVHQPTGVSTPIRLGFRRPGAR